MSIVKNQMKQAEFVRAVWFVEDATIEDALKPEFYVHVGQYLHPRDRIELVPRDMSFYAELLVVSCGKQWAKVVPIVYLNLAKPEKSLPGYKVSYNPRQGWRVIRNSDKELMVKDLPDKEAAEKWVEDLNAKVE